MVVLDILLDVCVMMVVFEEYELVLGWGVVFLV